MKYEPDAADGIDDLADIENEQVARVAAKPEREWIMAKWTKANAQPVTSEKEVRVRNIKTGEEGWVSVSSENREHSPRFSGSVKRYTRYYFNADGSEFASPDFDILDRTPEFV